MMFSFYLSNTVLFLKDLFMVKRLIVSLLGHSLLVHFLPGGRLGQGIKSLFFLML